MSKAYSFLSSKIRIWFLVLVILFPAIFALPPPISWRPFYYNYMPLIVNLMNESHEKKAAFPTFPIPTKAEAFGKSLFSSLLGIETKSMSTYVCASNISQIIYREGRAVDSQVFLNDGGIADIYINLNQDKVSSPIKIPLASSTCEFIIAEIESGIGNEVSWIVGPKESFEQKLERVVFKMGAGIGFKFEQGTYMQNYFILLGGLIILLSSLIQVLQFLRREDDKYFCKNQ